MSWFMNLRLQWKIVCCFGVVLTIVAVTGLHTFRIDEQDRLDTMRLETSLSIQLQASGLKNTVTTTALHLERAMSAGGADLAGQYATDEQQLTGQLETLERMAAQSPGKERVAGIRREIEAWKMSVAGAMMSGEKGKEGGPGQKEMGEILAATRLRFDTLQSLLDATVAAEGTVARELYLEGDAVNEARLATVAEGTGAALAISLLIALVSGRAYARPLEQTAEMMEAVAAGDFTRRLEVRSRDELGRSVLALNGMVEGMQDKVDRMLKVVRMAAAGDLTHPVEVTGPDPLGQMGIGLDRFLTDLRESISSIAQSAMVLSGSSVEMTAVSRQMSDTAEETSLQAGTVSAASEQVSRNVQTVAAGAEQMSASIKEIAKSASEAARVALSAVRIASSTNETVGRLGESSEEIGKVLKVITSIAAQTNLLALNATIEAARAGDAGRGFAVVANEVKELARETSRAADDITQRIAAIQTDTQSAVAAIHDISQIVEQISDFQNTIASAVEEQTATTNEITRSVTEAARGSSEIAESIMGVAEAAQGASAGAAQIQGAAVELSQMAGELQGLVGRFRYEKEGGPAGQVASVVRTAAAKAESASIGSRLSAPERAGRGSLLAQPRRGRVAA